MVVHNRKKNKRMRATQTHGWGAKKKHRGSGNKGGKGMAGTGKRAHSKKPSIWGTDYFGKHGFVHHSVHKKINAVNIIDIDKTAESLVKKGFASKEGSFYVIDIKKLGYNKILGKGTIKNKLKIYADYASAGSIEKVKEHGGEVILSGAGPSGKEVE